MHFGSLHASALLFLAIAIPAAAQNTCTEAHFAGPYGFTITGVVVNTNGGFYPAAESGTVTADGNGNLSGSATLSQAGHIQSQSFTGTYTVNSDCTGTVTTIDSNGPAHFSIVIVDNGQQILFIETDAGVSVSGSAKPQATNCTTQTVSGSYGYAFSGWLYDSSGRAWGYAESGKVVADGMGGLSSVATASAKGTIVSGSSTGTYSVNADCTGQVTYRNGGGQLNFVVVASGREVDYIETENNTVISGSATVLGNGGGSIAHVASGGGWQTTFTIANTGTVASQAELSFFDNNGNLLALPLTGVQSGAVVTKSRLTETIAPGATLVISTQASTALIGSAQLTSSGAVSGYAVFRYNPTGQEAVVPLETRNASAYVLAFDNTNGTSTGVALANSSVQSVKVRALLRDSSGASLGTETINIPPHGHTSFELASSYASAAGKQGTVEFDVPGGGGISVVGLRSTPTGALTTIPVLTK